MITLAKYPNCGEKIQIGGKEYAINGVHFDLKASEGTLELVNLKTNFTRREYFRLKLTNWPDGYERGKWSGLPLISYKKSQIWEFIGVLEKCIESTLLPERKNEFVKKIEELREMLKAIPERFWGKLPKNRKGFFNNKELKKMNPDELIEVTERLKAIKNKVPQFAEFYNKKLLEVEDVMAKWGKKDMSEMKVSHLKNSINYCEEKIRELINSNDGYSNKQGFWEQKKQELEHELSTRKGDVVIQKNVLQVSSEDIINLARSMGVKIPKTGAGVYYTIEGQRYRLHESGILTVEFDVEKKLCQRKQRLIGRRSTGQKATRKSPKS